MKVDRKGIPSRMSQDIYNTSRTMQPGSGNRNLQDSQRSLHETKTSGSASGTAHRKNRSWHAAAKVYAGVGSGRTN